MTFDLPLFVGKINDTGWKILAEENRWYWMDKLIQKETGMDDTDNKKSGVSGCENKGKWYDTDVPGWMKTMKS